MKTKLITVLILFLTYHLSAQFHFKVSMDESGLYSVKLKSEVPVNQGSLVGSGQISLTAPIGGFKIGEITSVNGLWNSNYDVIGKEFDPALTDEYYFIGLKEYYMADKNIAIGEEITLITFRNVGTCTGTLKLIDENDLLFAVIDSIIKAHSSMGIQICWGNNPANDLSVFDTLEQALYKFSGTYDLGQTSCNPYVNYSPLTEIIKLEVDRKGLNQFSFNWTPVEHTSFYELKIRQKGKLNWEKKIISTKPTAYLYSPQAGKYEYQVIAHQNTKITQSEIANFSNLVTK